MPSANVEVVRRGVAAWSRQDFDAMLREYDPQVHVVDPERAGAGPFVGHDAYRRWYAEWLESWEEYDIEHEAIVEVGDHVVLFQRHVGRANARIVWARQSHCSLRIAYVPKGDAVLVEL